jgi:hypothetical protein
MRRIILLSSLLLALCGGATAEQVYKWVDAQGVTHYSKLPPSGQDATTVNTPSPPAKASDHKPAPVADRGTDSAQAPIDAKVKKQVAEQEAQRQKYCEAQRNNLAQMEHNPRVRVEENGEMRRIGEEERQQRMAESREAIRENCT